MGGRTARLVGDEGIEAFNEVNRGLVVEESAKG
jgi:hypothetical protein